MTIPDELIPRSVLLRNPTRALFKISPDGQRLAYLGDHKGQLAIWVLPRDRSAAARVISPPAQRGITDFYWTYTGDRILYLHDDTGKERWFVNSIDVETGQAVALTPMDGTTARILSLTPRRPDRVLLAITAPGAATYDLYEADVRGGDLQRTEQNPGFAGYVVDSRMQAQLAHRLLPDGACQYLHRTAGGRWEELFRVPFEDQLTTAVEWVDLDHSALYLRDSRDRNTSALTRIDLRDGSTVVLAQADDADLGRVLIHPVTDELQAVSFEYDRIRWEAFDERAARVLDAFGAGKVRDVDILSRSIDDRFWVAAVGVDHEPASFHLCDRDTGSIDRIASGFDGMENLPFGRMHPVRFAARDGLEITAYLQLPRWMDPDGTGRPARPLPTIILVHGGPWTRDHWGFNPSAQWLANRGYATLSVNYRGSAGFGKAFLNAGNLQWGAKMQDDLLDAADWAIAGGIAQRDRIGLMGSSYGGYATLAGLAFTPERFACGVDLSGPADLVSFLESVPTQWEPLKNTLATRVGDPRTAEGRALLASRSPLGQAGEIRSPLLILHGENDPRIPATEPEAMVKRLRDAGKPVVYVTFPDEGHAIAKPRNAQAFAAIAELFLARTLGGRAEPVAHAVSRSSAIVRHGAEWLGL